MIKVDRKESLMAYKLKWIKNYTDSLENNKIELMLSEKNGIAMFGIWQSMLLIAGKDESGKGRLMFTSTIPYDEITLSKKLKLYEVRKKDLVHDTILFCLKFQMIYIDESSTMNIYNWEEYQEIDKQVKKRVDTRERVNNYRKKEEQSNAPVTRYNSVTHNDVTHLDVDVRLEEKRIEENTHSVRKEEEKIVTPTTLASSPTDEDIKRVLNEQKRRLEKSKPQVETPSELVDDDFMETNRIASLDNDKLLLMSDGVIYSQTISGMNEIQFARFKEELGNHSLTSAVMKTSNRFIRHAIIDEIIEKIMKGE